MKNLFLLPLCGLLGGCSTPAPTHRGAALLVKPELMLIVPDEAPAAQVSPALPASPAMPTTGAVLIAPDVIAYPLAGREDPQHKDLMYGGSWVYRRTSPKWRLQPAPSPDFVVGPVKHDDRSEIRPIQNQELNTFLLEQRTLNDQNRQAITRLIRLQQDLQNQMAQLHRASPARAPETSVSDETNSAQLGDTPSSLSNSGLRPDRP